MTERLRALILEGAGDKEIQYQALKEGMHTLFMSGLRSVYMGDTSLDEVLRVVEVTDVDILLCPNCSALVEEEWFHCVNCGEKLDFHCPNCSKPIKKSYSYCLNCGHDLEKAQPESRPEKSRSLPRELRSEKGELERPVLLAVDDDPKMLKIVELTFRDMFKTVLKAETGEEGLRLAQKHLPDLLVLDVMMPGISGFDVCRKLRGSLATSQIPVILLTAVSEEEGQEEGTEVGADDYITKPFSPDKLRSRAQMVLKGQNKLLGTPDKI
ncbi:MAG: response regulator [Planctomycetota bacterium]|nr:response regulator [Planctomycetota bacterium]